ncbi:hypothetical protein VTI74DRAFT_1602 [Chaetomium olivicolor]
MAPEASHPPIDLRAQIIENCKFFTGPHCHPSLIVAKDPIGKFEAIVLKSNELHFRGVLLSETGASVPEALQALLLKSAEAVENHISTNGFEYLTPEAYESLSDDETVSVTSVGRADKHSQRMVDKAAKGGFSKPKARQPRAGSRSSSSTIRSCSRSTSSSSGSDIHSEPRAVTEHRQSRPGPAPAPPLPACPNGIAHTPSYGGTTYPAPHPPPPFHINPPVPVTTTITPATPATSAFAPVPPTAVLSLGTTALTSHPTPSKPTQGQGQQQQHMYDILLQINWPEHGTWSVLEQTPHIILHGIQLAALKYAQRRVVPFTSLAGLGARVKSVCICGMRIDLTCWQGNDLTDFIRGRLGWKGRDVPMFEVEVSRINNGATADGNGAWMGERNSRENLAPQVAATQSRVMEKQSWWYGNGTRAGSVVSIAKVRLQQWILERLLSHARVPRAPEDLAPQHDAGQNWWGNEFMQMAGLLASLVSQHAQPAEMRME